MAIDREGCRTDDGSMAAFRRIASGDYQSADGRYRLWRLPGVHPPAWNVEDEDSGALVVDGAATKRDAVALLAAHLTEGSTSMDERDRFIARYRDGYYVVIDTATGNVVPSPRNHYKRYRDGYLWDYAAASEAERLNGEQS